MPSILEDLATHKLLISDGGWGSFLIAKGLEVGACPERWNIERRGDVLDVARSYAEAGADLITTNSFGGNRFRLAHYGLETQADAVNEAAAAISREAAGPDRHVHASIGPTGKMLMMGEVTEGELHDVFREQAVALERGGADAACIETMADTGEAVSAIRAVREHTRLEIICTFTFQLGPDDSYHTMMGVTPEAFADAVLEAGAQIIGANCTLGPAEMVGLVRRLRAAAPDTPILVQPNAGQPEPCEGGLRYPESPDRFAAHVPALIAAGANLLGGCCGTGPDHIRAIRAAAERCLA